MDTSRLDRLFLRYQNQEITLKRLLLDIQVVEGILKQSHLEMIHERFNEPMDELLKWVRITKSLELVPEAKHYLKLCMGFACSKEENQAFRDELYAIAHANPELLHIQVSGCMGLCGLGPNVIFDNQVYDHANSNPLLLNKLKNL